MSAAERHRQRAEAAHVRAMAAKGPRWLCHVPDCGDPGPHPAASVEAPERAAMAHYTREHYGPGPPADLEERRAEWIAAGRPPLGEFLAQRPHPHVR